MKTTKEGTAFIQRPDKKPDIAKLRAEATARHEQERADKLAGKKPDPKKTQIVGEPCSVKAEYTQPPVSEVLVQDEHTEADSVEAT